MHIPPAPQMILMRVCMTGYSSDFRCATAYILSLLGVPARRGKGEGTGFERPSPNGDAPHASTPGLTFAVRYGALTPLADEESRLL